MKLGSIFKRFAIGFVKNGYWYNNIAFRECKKFWEYNTFNTDVMNIGSASGVYAFNYDGLPIKGANFSMCANPQCADLAILKCYYSYLNPQKSTVIIALCPFTALSGNYEYLEDKYYTILAPPSMPVFYFWKKQEVMEKKKNPLKYYPFSALFSDIKHYLRSDKKPIMSETQMAEDAQRKIAGWVKEFSMTSFEAPLSPINKDAKDEAIRLLNDTIEFCNDRNITPVVVIPPLYHTLSELITPKARKILFDSLFDNIRDKNVRILNYYDDKQFNNERSYFIDSFRMSKNGAKVFTQRVLTDIDLL